ncbi:MAG: transcription antitermination factor NusB [Candidatus Omnitrophica bacterium]|nr:transcription antitermination factor NusB [Candidatus Omnitrophota bacterium]
MRKRTRAREFALQILYQRDITHDPYDTVLANFWAGRDQEQIDENLKGFTEQLVKGTLENLTFIDAKITQYATNWQLARMPVVDRNVLRLGCFELIFCQDIPPKVSINEAVELAKKYSGPEAGKFVNAILDKIKQDIKK